MIIGTSLKMYFSHERTLAWLRELAEIVSTDGGSDIETFVIPQFPSIPACVEIASPAGIGVGAQNCAASLEGAFTGEVSAAVLAEIGCQYVEIGHAERRRLFHETDADVAEKMRSALASGLVPILCVGEPEEGDPRRAAEICIEQVRAARSLLDTSSGRIIVAYEPLWAIGAPKPAGAAHIRAVCAELRERTGLDVIYGGSAGPGLLASIADSVDGMFLGRFAHDAAAFRTILQEVRALAA